MKVEITTNVYALSEHDHDALPYPMPADTWLWQRGDRWVAQVGTWYIQDWWEGADQEDIDARPERWARHILDVPTSGTLVYLDAEGIAQEYPLRGDELPYSVSIADPRRVLRRFATEDEAAEFVGTLEGHDDGIYFLDGPER